MAHTSNREVAQALVLPQAATVGSGRILPGLLLAVLIALTALLLQQVPGFGMFSPLILAILLGMAFHNLIGTPEIARAGVAFSLKRVLRVGIVLLGLQLTVQQVIAVGGSGVVLIIITVLATFAFATILGRWLRISPKLTQLIAAGSAICGASAVIAANTVTRARDVEVAYAMACVTVFGSLSMVLMPVAGGLLDMAPKAYGLWTGASIHEVAQVVAAAYARGQEAGEFGTVAKLTRVMLLAPLVLILGAATAARLRHQPGGAGCAAPPMPWFVLGFIAMVGLASTDWLPEAVELYGPGVTRFLLATALAAMGLATDVRKLAAEGLRPALLGAGTWVFISLLSLSLVLILG